MRHCADLNHGLNGPRLGAAQRKAMQHTCSTSLPPLQKRRVCGAAANSDRGLHPGLLRRQRGACRLLPVIRPENVKYVGKIK